MSLINLKEALDNAIENNYAIGAFNISDLCVMSGILEAAEEKNSPVIISCAESHFKFMDYELIMESAIKAARRSNVPVVLHLDHGKSNEAIMKAIRYGASSVMIDASKETLKENIKIVSNVVNMCKHLNISVEGELGKVGGGEGNGGKHIANEDFFTDINEASEFVKNTNIDALAISCGNVHGLYKGEPKLDFDRIEKIFKKVKVPLVLHGGSGISDDDFKKSISLGIKKINFYTGNSMEFQKELNEYMKKYPYENGNDCAIIWNIAKEAFKKVTMHNMDVFNSSNKANNF